MRRLLAFFILPIVLTGCAATHMRVVDQKPDFKAEKEATLVIIRDQTLPVIAIWNYLDNKLIGETKGKMYFITRISPGQHYVISESENITVVRMNFEAGKVYYLHQDIWPGAWRANAGLSVMNQSEALKAMKGCAYWEYDPKNPGEDLNPGKYEKGVKDYHIAVEQDPAAYKPFLEYPGYKP
jgi:hypothetical protein